MSKRFPSEKILIAKLTKMASYCCKIKGFCNFVPETDIADPKCLPEPGENPPAKI